MMEGVIRFGPISNYPPHAAICGNTVVMINAITQTADGKKVCEASSAGRSKPGIIMLAEHLKRPYVECNNLEIDIDIEFELWDFILENKLENVKVGFTLEQTAMKKNIATKITLLHPPVTSDFFRYHHLKDQLKRQMDDLTSDEDRYEIISRYCKSCGSKNVFCPCRKYE